MTIHDDWNTQCTHDDRNLLEDILGSKDLAAYERFVFDYHYDRASADQRKDRQRGIELAIVLYAYALEHSSNQENIETLEMLLDHRGSLDRDRKHSLTGTLEVLPLLSDTSRTRLADTAWRMWFEDDTWNAEHYVLYARLAECTAEPESALKAWAERVPRTDLQFMQLLEDDGLSLQARRMGLANQAASNWMAHRAEVGAFLPKNEGERIANLPFQYSGAKTNQELIQTFCPNLWPMLEALASPRDWRDPDVLVTLGRQSGTPVEAVGLPNLEPEI